MSLEKNRRKAGLLFVLPFVIGFLIFFIRPVIASIGYAFSALEFTPDGLVKHFVSLRNFSEALFADPLYVRTIVESIRNMFFRVPIILFLSLFIALILNGKFRGRTIFRAIFFLPVVIVNGIIMEILSSDYLSSSIMSGNAGGSMIKVMDSYGMLLSMGIPEKTLDTLVPFVYSIFELIWSCGVPILLFLAALQTISPALYEVAEIEGATKWEGFWKITFPCISPMILMNCVYIVADYFTTTTNPVIKMIAEESANMRFEYASGLSWMYLLVIGVIVGSVFLLINKHVVYTVD